MARIVSEETSLGRRLATLGRETATLVRLVRIEAALAIALLLAGGIRFAWTGRPGLLWGGLAAAALAAAHRLRIRENRAEERATQAGLRGEASVARTLSERLDASHYLFNDLRVRAGRTRAQIDHLVVGPRGLFVIETKNWRGRVEGRAGADRWTQNRGDGRPPVSVANPIRQVRRQADILGRVLASAGIGPEDMHALVVFRSPQTDLHVADADLPLLDPAEAARHIAGFTASRALPESTIDAVVNRLAGRRQGGRISQTARCRRNPEA